MRKIILLLLVSISGMANQEAFAYDIEVYNIEGVAIYYNYINNGTELEVTNKTGTYYSGSINIPSSITLQKTTYLVTSIGNNAFAGCVNLASVYIPYGVLSIGEDAFQGCKSLKVLEIPTSVKTIGMHAFQQSGLTSLVIPNNVEGSLGSDAFYGCNNLRMAFIGDGITSIDNSMFYKCKELTAVHLGKGVKSIGNYAFYECGNLTSVVLSAEDILESIGECAFSGCISLRNLDLPYIGSLTSIGRAAFANCTSLEAIIVPEAVKVIEASTFYKCTNLKMITISNSNIQIMGNGTLPHVMANNLLEIGPSAFLDCVNLKECFLPNSLQTIGSGAFSGCSSIYQIDIPSKVETIGSGAFNYCKSLFWVNVASGNTVFDSRDNCNAIVEKATNTLVSGCYGTTIDNSVTRIAEGAFMGQVNLKSIVVPATVEAIESKAFYGCDSLISVTMELPNPIHIDANVFSNSANATLYVPVGSVEDYKNADNWKNFKRIVEIGTADEPSEDPAIMAADVNGDGEVTITDAVAVVKVILNGGNTPAARVKVQKATRQVKQN